ncbi:MAG: NAD(P)-dependent oxidoreductase [Victivallales bacterium]|nr:NAD(P)-dependent oxidoreductase [Victivallales bacterium]
MFALEGKRIFLTGGTGFFGKSILSLLRRGFLPETELVILSRDPYGFMARHPELAGLERVSFTSGDVRSFPFPAGRFDAVIHAATPAVTDLRPGEMAAVILGGTRRVIEFSRHCGAQRLLLTGSGAVYGVQPPELEQMPEDFPCRPVTEYGRAKYEAEQLCAASGIYTLLPRCFAFVGPYLNREIHFAVGNFIRDALAGKTIQIKGDGTPYRSYLDADDLVEWLFGILARGESGVPYNVGSDHAVSIRELAQIVRSVVNPAVAIEVAETPRPGALPPRYVPAIDRAGALGLTVKYDLAAAIRRAVG